MRDMSVSSSRQFAGIHTQLDMPPRLAFFSPFFTGAVRSGLRFSPTILISKAPIDTSTSWKQLPAQQNQTGLIDSDITR